MGANQSTRKITVVNDEVSGVIKISDAVVQRLKGEISGEAASKAPAVSDTPSVVSDVPVVNPNPLPPPEPKSETPAAPAVDVAETSPQTFESTSLPTNDNVPPPAVSPPVIESAPSPPAPPIESAPVEAQAPAHVWQRPIIQYIEEPSLSALRVRAEKEEELKRLEDYWKDRLRKQEEDHIANTKLTEEEILKNSKRVETLFTPASNREICRDSRLAVQSCYSENPSKPLLCRDKVLEFSNCVNKSRMELLSPSG